MANVVAPRAQRRNLRHTGRYLLAALLLVGACRDPVSADDLALNAAEARWNDRRPQTNSYTMQQRVECFCLFGPEFLLVTVVNGAVASARSEATSDTLPTASLNRFKTVEQLFSAVRNANATPGAFVAVRYDETLGYPTTVSLDPDRQIADEEVSYSTRAVTLK
jgi:Family of unknown function (DUF6174)